MSSNSLSTRMILWAAMAAAVLIAGCSASTRDISPDETIHYDESYDFTDKKAIVEAMVASLVTKSPLAARNDRPVMIIYNVANRTSEHIATDGITDDIRQKVMESGKAQFVNKEQRDNIERELAYQYGGNVLAETRTARARQIGAEYMLSGTLRSIEKEQQKQIRWFKKEMNYYSLVLELTNLQTGLIEWTDNKEIVRESSRPFIGW
ncbi:MAG: penicillin-binding protein activator LpoB [Desulfobacterales bacterium]|nr:penicillin-binding protein activator LpoB [Desulfobacterales bacterium]